MTDAKAANDAPPCRPRRRRAGDGPTPDDKYLVGFYQLQLGILNKDQTLQATVWMR